MCLCVYSYWLLICAYIFCVYICVSLFTCMCVFCEFLLLNLYPFNQIRKIPFVVVNIWNSLCRIENVPNPQFICIRYAVSIKEGDFSFSSFNFFIWSLHTSLLYELNIHVCHPMYAHMNEYKGGCAPKRKYINFSFRFVLRTAAVKRFSGTECSLNIVFFPWNFEIFLNSASFAAALGFYLPGVCTHTDTEGKQRRARVRNILKYWKKTQYLMNTL